MTEAMIRKETHLALMREKSLALIKCNNAWAKLYDKLESIKEKFKEYDQPPLGMTRTKIIEQIREIIEPTSEVTETLK